MSENNTELRNAAYGALHGKLTEGGLTPALETAFPYEGSYPTNDELALTEGDSIPLTQVREVATVSTALAWGGREFPAEAVAGLAGMLVRLVDELRSARVELEAVSA